MVRHDPLNGIQTKIGARGGIQTKAAKSVDANSKAGTSRAKCHSMTIKGATVRFGSFGITVTSP